MSDLLWAAAGSALASGTLGVFVGFMLFKAPQKIRVVAKASASVDDHVEQTLVIDTKFVVFGDLTSHVSSEVLQYSQRINEITRRLDPASNDGPQLVLAAGKQLISANHELQSELERAKAEIERQRNELGHLVRDARTDPLTSLFNRRAFDQELLRMMNLHQHTSSPVSMIMIDIDHFKRLNDQYGHMVGDQVLKACARCMANALGDAGFLARIGGEEFMIILGHTELPDAILLAERVRLAIKRHRFAWGNITLSISASMGVKQIRSGESDRDFYQQTDEALLAAKRCGRNCCCFHDGTAIQRATPVTKSTDNREQAAAFDVTFPITQVIDQKTA